MVADKREFVRLDVGYLDNPKVADALDASPFAVLAHVASMTYCRQHRTDGLFAVNRILRKVGASAADALVLIELGLWVDLGSGKAELHDYLKHQESAEQIARLSEAGKKGAASRWAKQRTTDRTPNRNADRYAEERRGEKRREEASGFSVQGADRIATEPPPDSHPQPEFGNIPAVLQAAGLAQTEVREFLVDLKSNNTRNTSALVSSLHRDGKLTRRIAEWRDERNLAAEASSRPRPGKRTTDDKVADGFALAEEFRAMEAGTNPNVIPLRQIEGA